MTPIILDGLKLTPERVMEVAVAHRKVALCGEAGERVRRCREMVEELLASGQVVYGVTAGSENSATPHISPQTPRSFRST